MRRRLRASGGVKARGRPKHGRDLAVNCGGRLRRSTPTVKSRGQLWGQLGVATMKYLDLGADCGLRTLSWASHGPDETKSDVRISGPGGKQGSLGANKGSGLKGATIENLAVAANSGGQLRQLCLAVNPAGHLCAAAGRPDDQNMCCRRVDRQRADRQS